MKGGDSAERRRVLSACRVFACRTGENLYFVPRERLVIQGRERERQLKADRVFSGYCTEKIRAAHFKPPLNYTKYRNFLFVRV